MKIEAVTLRELHMPLVHFFETSFGRIHDRRVTLVTVHCEGVEGWGECVADEGPYYSEECADTAWPVLRQYLIRLLRPATARLCLPEFAGTGWPKPRWKMLCGRRRRIRSRFLFGNFLGERGRKY